MWVDYWGGQKGMLAPPQKLLGGPGPPWPPLFLRLWDYKGSEQQGSKAYGFIKLKSTILP